MRPILFPLLLCTTSTALAIDIDAQEERIAEAERRSADCSADGLHALFALAASDEIDGVDPSEQLSEVNEIAFFRCPGPFLTDISEAWEADKREHQPVALGRPGYPAEIVTGALMLASPASSYTTGALLQVDGGPR